MRMSTAMSNFLKNIHIHDKKSLVEFCLLKGPVSKKLQVSIGMKWKIHHVKRTHFQSFLLLK